MKKKIVKEPINYDVAWFGAFRYYLGRMTIATHCFIDALWIAVDRGEVSKQSMMIMVSEIEIAKERNQLGMEMDIRSWHALFVRLNEVLESGNN